MSFITINLSLLTITLLIGYCKCDEPYFGKRIGTFNTYHHQVSGEVFAVDEYTFYIKGFTYDGNGQDAYFWAGATNRPGNQGFLIPDDTNRTNVLSRYYDKNIYLTLPDQKKITDIKWLSIHDLSLSATYADIMISKGFQPPSTQSVTEFSQESNNVQSGVVEVIDSKTIRIPGLHYDSRDTDARFWVGTGPQPTAKGRAIHDERGYYGSIRSYNGEDVTLSLPGNLTIFDIDWLSIFDIRNKQSTGFVNIPEDLNVPPSRDRIVPNENRFPNCEQLHSRLQVSWEVFGPQVTIQLAGQIGEEDYIAFGFSGSENGTHMIGADVAIVYLDGALGYVVDYNITEKCSCADVLGAPRGVCPDQRVGGLSDVQLLNFVREDGITKITYLRMVTSADSGDKNFLEEEQEFVWAIGHLSINKNPLYHYLYPKGSYKLNFMRSTMRKNCDHFTIGTGDKNKPWSPFRISIGQDANFTAVLGPPGGSRGYEGITGQASSDQIWYINGFMAPEIFVTRGERYTFAVFGGNDVNRPRFHHPFYITNDQNGGYEQLTDEQRKKVKVYAGVDFDRRRRPIPTAVGSLCLWENSSMDLRHADEFRTFPAFRAALELKCEDGGDPASLLWVPNISTPDVVYYQSFRQPNMGWKIYVVDTLPVGHGETLQTTSISIFVTVVSVFIAWFQIQFALYV